MSPGSDTQCRLYNQGPREILVYFPSVVTVWEIVDAGFHPHLPPWFVKTGGGRQGGEVKPQSFSPCLCSQVALVVKKNPLAYAGRPRDLGFISGREEALEEEIAAHSSILGWQISMDRGAWWAAVHGVAKNGK